VSLVALAAAKASPGVTTTAVALAAVWPRPRAVLVVEADPAGGDLAARFGLASEPGLVTLAAARRGAATAATVAAHAQALPGGLRVVAGPPGGEQAAAALGLLGPELPAGLAGLDDVDVLADLGRLDPASPALPVARAADLLVLVTRPVLAELQHLAHRAAVLRQGCRALALVVVGAGPYPPGEVAGALGVQVVGVLPADPRGAGLLGGVPAGGAGLRRAPVVRAARTLTDALIPRLTPPPNPAPGPGPAPAPPAGPVRPVGAPWSGERP
jgi:hypothetical protein